MLRFIQRNQITSNIQLHESKLINQLLLSRGFQSAAEADAFLRPSLDSLHDPFLFRDMRIAVDIIQTAIRNQEKIAVFGDYDCDGVCASTILSKAIQMAGGIVHYTVPSREDGYGLNNAAIYQLSEEYRVLITVDLGIRNAAEIELAKSLGLKVIVSDHHQLPDHLPKADAILHPMLKPYPFPSLCGAGVAFKIACALLGERAFELLEFAAIATVGDIVPLLDENRILVRYGFERIKNTSNLGLKILNNLARLDEVKELDSGHIAFRIVPRINAAGRMATAKIAVDLFLSSSMEEAQKLAQELESLNQQRKEMEGDILKSALQQVEAMDFSKNKFIVVSGEGWHHGIIGLVAGKLCERYHLPVAAFTVGAQTATASLRSIPGINIYYYLKQCEDLFLKWGGHEQAAGLTLSKENIVAFTQRMNARIIEEVPSSVFVPQQIYDTEITLEEVTLANIEALALFHPTGEANPAPLFLSKGLNLLSAKPVGSPAEHLKLSVEQNEQKRDGIAFGMGNLYSSLSHAVDCIYSIEKNTFMGQSRPQLMVKAVQSTLEAEIEKIKALQEDVLNARRIHFLTSALLKYRSLHNNFTCESNFDANNIYGNLIISYNKNNAIDFYQKNIALFDFCLFAPNSSNGQNCVVLAPDFESIPPKYSHIVFLDGIYCREQMDYVKTYFAEAEISVAQAVHTTAVNALYGGLDRYRMLYRELLKPQSFSAFQLSRTTELSEEAIHYALFVFENLGLLQYDYKYQRVQLASNPQKCDIESNILVKILLR